MWLSGSVVGRDVRGPGFNTPLVIVGKWLITFYYLDKMTEMKKLIIFNLFLAAALAKRQSMAIAIAKLRGFESVK